MYYKELYKDEKPAKDAPKVSKFRPRNKPPKSGRRCASTTPEPSVREQHRPTRRSSSAMLRAVSEATSTSEVCCRLNQKYLSIIHHNLYTAINMSGVLQSGDYCRQQQAQRDKAGFEQEDH